MEFTQDPVISAQGIVNGSHEVVTVAVHSVVECVAASIVAKFFVFAAHQGCPAFVAISFHFSWFKKRLYGFIQKQGPI